ncbi:MAG: flagellar basal body rod protein FlgC [Pseudomonadales bacterium]|nr:flagellar basal body rod protein FlgC [Pseudomonadales bacterium]
MALFSVFDIAASGMNAQSVRLNTVASNLANADSAAATEAEAYRAKKPIFSTLLMQEQQGYFEGRGQASFKVNVDSVTESMAAIPVRYEPNHPLANADGNVFYSNVDTVEEMADMMSATRAYQSNVELFSASKSLMIKTLQLGQS